MIDAIDVQPLGPQLPHDDGAEVTVLIAAIHRADKRDDVLAIVQPEQFYAPARGRILGCIAELVRTGRAVDLVGPICESTDRFAKDRPMPPLKEGDLVAFMTAGAYGATLSSQYNSRPLVAEALVRGDACAVVRRRPTFEEMIALERAPDWIASG